MYFDFSFSLHNFSIVIHIYIDKKTPARFFNYFRDFGDTKMIYDYFYRIAIFRWPGKVFLITLSILMKHIVLLRLGTHFHTTQSSLVYLRMYVYILPVYSFLFHKIHTIMIYFLFPYIYHAQEGKFLIQVLFNFRMTQLVMVLPLFITGFLPFLFSESFIYCLFVILYIRG